MCLCSEGKDVIEVLLSMGRVKSIRGKNSQAPVPISKFILFSRIYLFANVAREKDVIEVLLTMGRVRVLEKTHALLGFSVIVIDIKDGPFSFV